MTSVLSQVPDLAACLLHVSCVFVYDLAKSSVIDRLYDVIVACHVDDGGLVVVVPFQFRRGRRVGHVWVPVVVVPVYVAPEPPCVAVLLEFLPLVSVGAVEVVHDFAGAVVCAAKFVEDAPLDLLHLVLFPEFPSVRLSDFSVPFFFGFLASVLLPVTLMTVQFPLDAERAHLGDMIPVFRAYNPHHRKAARSVVVRKDSWKRVAKATIQLFQQLVDLRRASPSTTQLGVNARLRLRLRVT